MKDPWLVLIESNTTGTGLLFAKAACTLGYRPILLTEQPQRYSYLQRHLIPFRKTTTSSLEVLFDDLRGLSREAPVCGIFSSSEYFIETAATLARKWGLSGADPQALRTCRNKWTQRKCLRKAGVRSPRCEYAASDKEVSKALTKLSLPVVVKPTMGSGSVGVRLCRTVGETLDHAASLLSRNANERGMVLHPEVLLEEYVPGPEYSAEVFQGTTLGITRKHLSREPYFVERGHDFPTTLPHCVQDSIIATTQKSLQALGLLWGPAHVELRLTPDGPVIIEVNPRLAGGFIPEIIRMASGIDIIRETIRLVAGEDVKFQAHLHCDKHASIRFLTASARGVIKEITGVDDASRIPGVKESRTYLDVGDRVEISNDFRDRIGHVIAVSDFEVGAAESAEQGLGKIGITLE